MKHWARPPLDGHHFDVAVIGGGINGVAIARQCALAGKRVLLVEQNDFASGTTSRSTRIIHGGLRYLEHGEFSLVRESLRERQRLLLDRGHLVRPLTFLLSLPEPRGFTRNAHALRFGLWLYRKLAGQTSAQMARGSESVRFERELDRNHRWATFRYEDAQCEFPERLVAEWLVEAGLAGAAVRNHTEVLEIVIRDGRVGGLQLRDHLTRREFRVSATQVVNATGPWADRLCARSNLQTRRPMIGGVRGTHIVVPRYAEAPEAGIYTEAPDGRPVFVIPWNNDLLVGTTEVPDGKDPATATPTGSEIEYLLAALARIFPEARLGPADIRYAFSGVRPLPHTPDRSPSSVTRRHLLHDHALEGAAGLISVIGGKLTTAASLARDCARKLGIAVQEPRAYSIPRAEITHIDLLLARWVEAVSSAAGIGLNTARNIADWYGPRSREIAEIADRNAALKSPLCDHTPHIVAEAVHAVKWEYAATLGDILLRRAPIALSSHWCEACTRIAARRVASALYWTEAETAAQIDRFEEERAAFLVKVQPNLNLQPASSDSSPAQSAA